MVSENELVEMIRAKSARQEAQVGHLKRVNDLSMKMLGFQVMGNLETSRTSYSSTPVDKPLPLYARARMFDRPSTSASTREGDDTVHGMTELGWEKQEHMLKYRGLDEQANQQVEEADVAEAQLDLQAPPGRNRVDSSSNFLYFLWAKSPKTQKSCPSIRLPHSVIVEGGKVVDHFFMARNGVLMRKSGVSNSNKYRSLSQLLKVSAEYKRKTFLPAAVYRSSGESYLDAQHLRDEKLKAQFQMPVLQDGVYQNFVIPIGERNELLLATWVDGGLAVEKRICLYKLASKKVVEKFVMGDNHKNWQSFVIPMNMKNIWFRKIMETCNSIANHIREVSPQQYIIREMKLVFKQDDFGKLWLCWCTSVKVERHSALARHDSSGALWSSLKVHTKNERDQKALVGNLKEMAFSSKMSAIRTGSSRRKEFMPFVRQETGDRAGRLASTSARQGYTSRITCPPRDLVKWTGGRLTLTHTWLSNPLGQKMATAYRRTSSPEHL